MLGSTVDRRMGELVRSSAEPGAAEVAGVGDVMRETADGAAGYDVDAAGTVDEYGSQPVPGWFVSDRKEVGCGWWDATCACGW